MSVEYIIITVVCRPHPVVLRTYFCFWSVQGTTCGASIGTEVNSMQGIITPLLSLPKQNSVSYVIFLGHIKFSDIALFLCFMIISPRTKNKIQYLTNKLILPEIFLGPSLFCLASSMSQVECKDLLEIPSSLHLTISPYFLTCA